jgi:glycerol-3-phosphate dehydrogenase (NAD(P)+)
MWGHDAEQLEQIKARCENFKFLPGHKLPESLQFEADDSRIFEGVDMAVSAVPCQYTRGVWERLSNHIPIGLPVVSVTKGIENETLSRPSEVIANVVGAAIPLAVLSGPTIADELARHLPASASVASTDSELAEEFQQTISVSWFRLYTNTDMVGVELAGAMKNVIAIAAGIADGTGVGDNAKAALVARGLAEIKRLGVAMGARAETFSGLSGIGDLVTTCISPKGRNRSFGERLGSGESVEEAISATSSVIEGISTCESVVELARRYNVDMPITQAIYRIVFEGEPVSEAVSDLMHRELKAE